MKKYQNPKIKVVELEAEQIVSASQKNETKEAVKHVAQHGAYHIMKHLFGG